ncbi:MAG: sulfurtransferase [Gammaproteobacteria bacterium CG11_big_fil_rev_8_21_14_0_20_46_22]|nr:MAG: sulfurtransferase [Gammaproteobacteria bacterium CG12_big_fil_rev_8_21_14_0_65_46_12]PIR10532.1 MAG: sulfurtransferase [Gammaproteobacteria bacterium CG11_big_fil_rev_8_21_14_0_20_46_22]
MSQISPEFQVLCDQARSRVQEITIQELNRRISETDEALTILDVREDYEWDEGRIFGAVHCGRGLLEFMINKLLPDTSVNIVVYCRSGNRSLLAADRLKQLGYTHVVSLQGGITAWAEAGYAVDGEVLDDERQLAMLKSE